MEGILYDTSWILHRISSLSPAYRQLFSASQRILNTRTQVFQFHLNQNKAKYEIDEEHAKIGGLRECRWTHLEHGRGLLMTLTYEKVTYRFILYGNEDPSGHNDRSKHEADASPVLLLAKASAAVTKKFISFLVDTFHVAVDPLKLSSWVLQNALETYLDTVNEAVSGREGESSAAIDDNDSRMQFLKSTFGNLKITFAFAAPVAPNLRTLEVDVPAETLRQLQQGNVSSQNIINGTNEGKPRFLAELARHIFNRTGFKMPVSSSTGSTGRGINPADQEDAVIRISRMSCAAFAIGSDGRLKFAGKAVEAAVDKEELLKLANEQMLNGIVAEIMRQSQVG